MDLIPLFKFVITKTGKTAEVSKDPVSPWDVGERGDEIEIVLVNDDDVEHQLKMIKIKHIGTKTFKDPLSGTKKWKASGREPSRQTTHKVKADADTGKYSFWVELDGVALNDPEIVVRPPDGPLVPAPPRPRRGGASAKKGSRKAAQSAATKRRGAKKAAASRKSGVSKRKKAAKRPGTRKTAKKRG